MDWSRKVQKSQEVWICLDYVWIISSIADCSGNTITDLFHAAKVIVTVQICFMQPCSHCDCHRLQVARGAAHPNLSSHGTQEEDH